MAGPRGGTLPTRRTLLGVGSAFWGLLAGGLALLLRRREREHEREHERKHERKRARKRARKEAREPEPAPVA